MMAGGIWDLLRIEYVQVVLAHLGYPMYLLTIIGAWKIPCAIVLFLPGFLRLKEWAYAGAVFNYTGAAASHFLAGYAGGTSPLVLVAITLALWRLRPPARQLAAPEASADQRAVRWVVPILILIVLFILSIVFLPKGLRPRDSDWQTRIPERTFAVRLQRAESLPVSYPDGPNCVFIA
jgi:hypothetical protein